MSCIHFKFKSSLDYEKVTFDGLHISLADLKDRIMKQKKIGLSNEFKLEVVDAQNKKVYSDGSEMIPRNTSVVIRRIPIANAPKLPKTQHKDPTLFPQAVCEIYPCCIYGSTLYRYCMELLVCVIHSSELPFAMIDWLSLIITWHISPLRLVFKNDIFVCVCVCFVGALPSLCG